MSSRLSVSELVGIGAATVSQVHQQPPALYSSLPHVNLCHAHPSPSERGLRLMFRSLNHATTTMMMRL